MLGPHVADLHRQVAEAAAAQRANRSAAGMEHEDRRADLPPVVGDRHGVEAVS